MVLCIYGFVSMVFFCLGRAKNQSCLEGTHVKAMLPFTLARSKTHWVFAVPGAISPESLLGQHSTSLSSAKVVNAAPLCQVFAVKLLVILISS